ncbi:hypothetical protein GCM10008955_19340 [Deinococcus malanensis]|uniref:Uncharacterized protein n=1 Tax=Deinococcus malanensis TaxID=1706855 RepID=A0ABQ2ETM7_9DEIO|nr:hypothetical protein [Deinococcus malanensis]GGK25726.1 hypothetical protein GCM10008955_19340 [Deinococcus malanensis]
MSVLGLLHADGTPITVECCVRLAHQLTIEYTGLLSERNELRKSCADDQREAALLREIERDLDRTWAVVEAWMALARAGGLETQ